jgi:8-oxo-dGTP pyrophosphatase MutT (NUDIX family)
MPPEIKKELSAGGVIIEDGRALLIMMCNLKGEHVWTFPKGHLEPGETPEDAALREVLEETGYECRIIEKLFTAHYSFTRNNFPVEKDVQWYLMEKTGGDGVPRTPDEILAMKWCGAAEAAKNLVYPSDLRLLGLVAEKLCVN